MDSRQAQDDWIAVDWGTSNLRVWVMRGTQVRERIVSDQGMGSITPREYEPVLLGLVAPYLSATTTRVLVCGMAGSRQGWAEAPYASVPCAPPNRDNAVSVATDDPRLSVSILPGMKQQTPADVMRGEETQIAGYLAQKPHFEGAICLPGTHSKWAQISAGTVAQFRTFMTGEVYALLSKTSILRHSVGETCDLEAFDAAVADMMRHPEAFTADLFGLRAGTLVGGLGEDAALGRLSGLMIGAEIAGARSFWSGQNVALIGAPKISALYARALTAQGVDVDIASGEDIVLEGLIAAYHQTEGQT
ncbi:2-dehydro-3-deoxygalactonokinase [Celeribacter sp.]|uniref:2-dehydro-3-deoxygalactonokinase n=1 Tax=Celeribacter sp. TaxID=1890673 RepID=UPI003A9359F6